jgi:hypothetical protein
MNLALDNHLLRNQVEYKNNIIDYLKLRERNRIIEERILRELDSQIEPDIENERHLSVYRNGKPFFLTLAAEDYKFYRQLVVRYAETFLDIRGMDIKNPKYRGKNIISL